MHISAPFIAQREATEAMQPRERALDDPAEDAQATAVRAARLGDHGDDALRLESSVSGGGPVGAVPLDDAGFAPRASPSAGHRG